MINIAIIQGYVGKKDTRTLSNGNEVTTISVATNKRFKDAQGNPKEQTTWHNVSCFSRLHEIASKHIQVGDLVFVRGEIQNKKIESGEKAGQYVYNLNANEIHFIPKANKENTNHKKNQFDSSFLDDSVPF
jgi:single-strand DNA-binding protein